MDYIHTITIPSTRFYLNALRIEDMESVFLTFTGFNTLKEWTYNRMYDEKFAGGEKFDASTRIREEMKKRFPSVCVPSYYVTSVYSTASGMISSQKELVPLYTEENRQRIVHAGEKAAREEKILLHYKKIKDSIIRYSRALSAGRKRLPQVKKFRDADPERCPVRDSSGHCDGKALYLYELYVDRKIRALSAKVSQIRHRIFRMKEKDFSVPRRATFGSRAFYRTKDTKRMGSEGLSAWHFERQMRRFGIIHISGRHDSIYGNFCCRYDVMTSSMTLRCWDGRDVVFPGISFPYKGDVIAENLTVTDGHTKDDIRSIGYTAEIHLDSRGLAYIIFKASFETADEHLNDYTGEGVISVDLNYDNISWSELNADGCRVDGSVISFDLMKGSTGRNRDTLGRTCTEIASLCRDRKKPLIMEDVNTQDAKTKMRYGSGKGNAHASVFAFSTMTEFLHNKCASYGVGVISVDPAYTSKISQMKYMMPMRVTIHEGASYVVGRRGMGFEEKVPGYLSHLSDGSAYGRYPAWRTLTARLKRVPKKCFYTKHKDNLDLSYYYSLS